jgi:hypothetical protein
VGDGNQTRRLLIGDRLVLKVLGPLTTVESLDATRPPGVAVRIMHASRYRSATFTESAPCVQRLDLVRNNAADNNRRSSKTNRFRQSTSGSNNGSRSLF